MRGQAAIEKRVTPLIDGPIWRSVEAFANLIEFPLDRWQISLITLALQGRGDWYISAMRKIGKTHLLGFVLLYLGALGYEGYYTSHKGEFVKEVFEFVLPYAEKLKQMGVVRRIEPSHGHLNIYFVEGGALKFRTRAASLRGGMRLDFVLWDEAQKMNAAAQDEVSGAMHRSKLRLQIFVGNPATDQDFERYPDSPFTQAKLANKRNFVEFSAASSYSPALKLTPAVLMKCNPNSAHIGDLDKLLIQEKGRKTHKVLAAELFGVWDLPTIEEKIDPELSTELVEKVLTGKPSNAQKFYLFTSIDYQSREAFMVVSDGVVVELATTIELPRGSVEGVTEWILKNKSRFHKIIIAETAKGKALISSLSSIKAKVEALKHQEFAVHMNRFISQAEAGSLRVYETAEVKAALSTFWLAYEQRTGLSLPQASNPEQLSLVNSLLMASLDASAGKRINAANAAAPITPAPKNEQDDIVHSEEKPIDPMAAYKEKAAARRRKKKEGT